jgi:filamentous hemagglutinin
MIAKGNIMINAVDGLQIDVKQVNQETVSQSIDAMVKADPKLAWLKEAEARGDVDWRQVKEIHESFKYSNSGLGPASQLIIAILMSVVMGPAGLGIVSASAGGVVATSLATTAVTSTINNKGDLGAALKETFSSDSLKGAAIAGVTAGVLNYADANWFAAASQGQKFANLLTSTNFTDIAIRAGGRAVLSSGISTAIGGGSFGDNLGSALLGEAGSVAMATGFKWVGDTIKFPDGGLQKIVAHAIMGLVAG